jgi:hypothetical protein
LVALGHHSLHRHGAFDRIDHRGKLKQHAVPGGLYEPTAVFSHESVGDLAVFAERARGADLVEAHEPREARYVSGDYGGQPAFDTTWLLLLHGQAAPGDTILPDMLPEASLSLGRSVVNKWNPWVPEEKRIGTAFAQTEVGGERVPKQISAEATNGTVVST